MAVFKKVRQLVKFEGQIVLGTNWLLTWIVDTYSTDIAMSIRRLVDVHRDPHCHSLYKFLKELMACTSSNIDASELQQDIDTIDRRKNPTLKKILTFTLQNKAHSDEQSILPNGMLQSRYTGISFDEDVFPMAEKIENLFLKYYMLITGKEPNFLETSYIRHTKYRIEEIENTFRRICEEKLHHKWAEKGSD
jgi:hypothetical protein